MYLNQRIYLACKPCETLHTAIKSRRLLQFVAQVTIAGGFVQQGVSLSPSPI